MSYFLIVGVFKDIFDVKLVVKGYRYYNIVMWEK